jgi:hypothetical protein
MKTNRAAKADFPDLASITRPGLDTCETAFYLNREPQTLRGWACFGNGPLQPRRVHGRLIWPTDAVRKLLGVEPE